MANGSSASMGPDCTPRLKEWVDLNNLNITLPHFRVSDDTVMHMATAKALIARQPPRTGGEQLYLQLAKEYCDCMNYMAGRSPGGGCGGAMRSMCIGIGVLAAAQPLKAPRCTRAVVRGWQETHNHSPGYTGQPGFCLLRLATLCKPAVGRNGEADMPANRTAGRVEVDVEETGRDLAEKSATALLLQPPWANTSPTRPALTAGGRRSSKQPTAAARRGTPSNKSLSLQAAGRRPSGHAPRDDRLRCSAVRTARLGSSGGGDEGSVAGDCVKLPCCTAETDELYGAIACCLYGLLNGGLEGVPMAITAGLEFRSELASHWASSCIRCRGQL
uniref:Uncharacterized protein n=1 Tax=Macrostomum lignano TaxID=282301 RepID=A0A1I8FQ73_9PLAT